MNRPLQGGFSLRSGRCAVWLGSCQSPRLDVVFAGSDGVEAQVELVFPAELEEGVVAESERSGGSRRPRGSEVAFGAVGGGGRELMRWLQDDHLVSIGLNLDFGKGRFGVKRRRSFGEFLV